MQNHFDLFHLPEQFDLETKQLDRAFREVQAQVHPDKFVGRSSVEQRVAMQWATRANEAYQTLKDPLKRAIYLCELHGISLQAESNTAMPTAFLAQQMAWREELDESQDDSVALFRLAENVHSEHEQQLKMAALLLAQADYVQAAQVIRQLMFLEKFSKDITHAREQI